MKILISISETKGIVAFLNKLTTFYSDIEIIATSGTNKYLKSHNIKVGQRLNIYKTVK